MATVVDPFGGSGDGNAPMGDVGVSEAAGGGGSGDGGATAGAQAAGRNEFKKRARTIKCRRDWTNGPAARRRRRL